MLEAVTTGHEVKGAVRKRQGFARRHDGCAREMFCSVETPVESDDFCARTLPFDVVSQPALSRSQVQAENHIVGDHVGDKLKSIIIGAVDLCRQRPPSFKML